MTEPQLENAFLIEIRLGRTKWRIKRRTEEICRIFRIGEYEEKHPHVTLFGPFSLKKEITVPHLLKAVELAARPFGSVPFLINGYEMNQGLNGAVLAYRIVPTEPLIDLNEAVSGAVSKLADKVNIWDTDLDQKWFHVTIANRLGRDQGAQIFRQLTEQSPVAIETNGMGPRILNRLLGTLKSDRNHDVVVPPPPPLLDEDGIRITVINGDRILAEYDLVQNRWFSVSAQHAAQAWQHSLKEFRRKSGIELTAPRHHSRVDCYVISDLHFSHGNIIRYCSRPFPHDGADEMDEMLIRNWNYTIKTNDRVYLLGDLSYGALAKSPFDYIRRLNGSISLLGGNHEKEPGSAKKIVSFRYKEIPFILVHDPADAPEPFGGWVIHGHHHNNDLARYPFINFEKRRINVSAEVVRYCPVSLTELCNIIMDHQIKPKIKSILLRET